MSSTISYKLKQYKNSNSSYNNFFYPRAVITGHTATKELAEKIQARCSLTKADVLGVLSALSEVMREEICAGNRVRVDGLGLFKAAIVTKKMVEDLKDFNVSECIAGYRINFLPEYSVQSGKRTTGMLRGAGVVSYQEYAEGVNDREGKKYNKVGKVTE